MENGKLQKSRNFWFAASMMLIGVVLGYLMSPAKNGFNIKNICGNGWAANDCLEEDDYAEMVECGEDSDSF
ncbi:MAG: hypothetical protein RR444_06500 [Oscillospiraceae bacterium]